MSAKYRFSLKSEELQGAGQPNIVYMELDSDADAAVFAENLENIFDADCVTVDSQLTTDFSLPYPPGTNREWRMVLRDATGIVQTERIYDVNTGLSSDTSAAALVTLGTMLILPKSSGGVVTPGGVITSCNIAEFDPTQSV